jgi:predicted RNA-binding Zn-ribbon protein involved in translation (DUF1610 family)
MTSLAPNARQPLRFLCPTCGEEVARSPIKQDPAPVVDCVHCGTLCALTRPGQGSRVADARTAIKVVPTGMAAIFRPV